MRHYAALAATTAHCCTAGVASNNLQALFILLFKYVLFFWNLIYWFNLWGPELIFPSADATNVFKMHVRYQVLPIWSRNRIKLFKYNKLFNLKSEIQFISYREHKQYYVKLQILNDLYLKYVLYCFYDIILLLSAFTNYQYVY